jgi:hypothetical protein
LAELAGDYRSEELLAAWRILVRHDSLFGRAGLGREFPLRPLGGDVFGAAGGRVTFVREGSRVTGLKLFSRGVHDLVLARQSGGQ